MSSNFLNLSGAFEGCDLHLYLALTPPSPIPTPVPFVPHVVQQLHLIGDYSKTAPSVTTTGCRVLQKGWKMVLVPHVFIPELPPHPAEWVNLAAIIILSSSAPKLSASTVHGQGLPLLVEELEAFGVNLDCSDSWLGFGADINVNTVKTTPTLKDYFSALAWMAIGSLTNKFFGRNSEASAAKPFAGRHREGDPIETISDAVRRQVQASAKKVVKTEAIRSALHEATDYAKDAVKDSPMAAAVVDAVSTFVG